MQHLIKRFFEFFEEKRKHHHHHKHAVKLIVSSININNNLISGIIMSVTLSKTQSVVATVTGLDSAGNVAPITGLSATTPDGTIVAIGAIDTTANTVAIAGVADGSVVITYTANDANGNAITPLTDTITVSDIVVVPLAVSLSVSSSAPVAQ